MPATSISSLASHEELEEVVDRQNRELEGTREVLNTMESEMENLAIEKQEAELEVAYKELETATALIERTTKQLKSRDDQISELRGQINRQRRNLGDMRKQLQILKRDAGATSNKASEQQISRLKNDLARLQNELTAVRETDRSAANIDYEKFEAEKAVLIDAMETRMNNLAMERERLKNEVRTLRSSNHELVLKLEGMEDSVAARTELDSAKKQFEGFHIEKQKLQANLAAAERELSNIKETMRQEHDDLLQKVLSLEHEVNLSKKELRERNNNLEEIEKTLVEKATQLENDINDTKAVLREASQELEVREAVEASLRTVYKTAEMRRGELEAEVERRDAEESMMGSWAKHLFRTLSKI